MTKEKFNEYLRIQKMGAVNMYNVNGIIELSENELDKNDILDISDNYDKYEKEYSD